MGGLLLFYTHIIGVSIAMGGTPIKIAGWFIYAYFVEHPKIKWMI